MLLLAARYAGGQLREARTLRREQQRPFVVVELVRNRPTIMDIAISNAGPVMATNVRFNFDPPLQSTVYDHRQAGGTVPPIAELPIFRDGLPTLAPGREIRFIFDHVPERFAADLPDRYAVTLSYDGPLESYPAEKLIVDLAPFRQTVHVTERGIHDLYNELAQISKELHKWTANGGGLLAVSPSEQRKRTEAWLADYRAGPLRRIGRRLRGLVPKKADG